MKERRIMQIMPADGWYWIQLSDGKRSAYPLVGWALVENTYASGETGTEVVGLDTEGEHAGIVPDVFAPTFDGYMHVSEVKAACIQRLKP